MEIIANTVNQILQFIVENISNSMLRFFYTGTSYEKTVIKFVFFLFVCLGFDYIILAWEKSAK